MSSWLVVLTGLIYGWVAGEQVVKDNWPTALMFFGYALANIGIFFQVK